MKKILHPSAYASEKPLLIMADTGESLSYAQFNCHANRCAQMFAALGCKTGDTVAIFSDNSLIYPELCWAAKNSGLHYACIASHLTTDEAAYIADNSGAKVLIAAYNLAENAIGIAAKCAQNVHLLMHGGCVQPFQPYECLRDEQPDKPLLDRPRGASMLYSSGTTGYPKGVRAELTDLPPSIPPLRQGLLVEQYGLSEAAVFVNAGPFYHAAPLRFMMAVQRMGGTTVGFKKFDAQNVLRAIETYQCTHGFFVPTMFVRMLALATCVRDAIDISSMRYAIHGAAPCTVAVKESMMEWWGPVLHELYGGTEGFGNTFITPEEWLQKKGSVGRAASGCEIRILDSQHCGCEPYQNGLVYMGNGRVFHYHKDQAKTKEVSGPGGLATMGDIGYLDKDGYLFLTDRQAHVIISGGVNIYPQEAETVLALHPLVEDVAVIGVPNSEYGEEVKAIVQLKQTKLSQSPRSLIAIESQLIAFCLERLSAIKCPRSVDFIEQLPRSEAGKLVKRQIKKKYWAGLEREI